MRILSPLLLSFLALTAGLAPLSAQTWSQSTTEFPTGSVAKPSVAFGNGIFVAAGLRNVTDGSVYVYSSTDGATWTERAIALADHTLLSLGHVRFINNRFVLVGQGWLGGFPRGFTATSPDGITCEFGSIS